MTTTSFERNVVILRDAPLDRWRVFRTPLQVVCTHAADEVVDKLRQLEDAVSDQGLYAAGFLAYEAAPGFDPALRVRVKRKRKTAAEGLSAPAPLLPRCHCEGQSRGDPPGRPDSKVMAASAASPLPLLWFGLYDRIEVITRLEPSPAVAGLPDWTASISEQEYRFALQAIREYLRQGDTYQVNFSFRLHAPFRTSPWDFFQTVCGADPPPYAAYVSLKDWAVCCFSPELFFSLDGRAILCKPMKGTRPRGMTLAEDRRLAEELRRSAKEQAENVMITDMVRNDLGRIALPGSVQPLELFAVEKHATVWQMTSSVAAHTERPLTEIFAALFPPASITGAPKVSTMGIIADLEDAPRRIYTGCIGYFGPGRKASFNVAIRTVLVDRRQGLAEYGVGGGIVWDSDSRGEYEECRIKTRVLSRHVPEFDLLETMLWTPDEGYILLKRHLARLCASAEYFDFPFDLQAVQAGLQSMAEIAEAAEAMAGPRMVRLLLSREGRIRIEDLPPPPKPSTTLRVILATDCVNSKDPFLYHKTTHRAVYEDALAGRPGFDDVLLYNERGEVTESTRANVLVRVEGMLYTPPITCGLLAGTMRAHLLELGVVVERVLTPRDLERAQGVYLASSVRGVREVVYVGQAG
jgi:para-aminobenzoate synthetase/4-amino-4-deoxychorismate lyase